MRQETIAIVSVGASLLVAVLLFGSPSVRHLANIHHRLDLIRQEISEIRQDVSGLRERVAFMEGKLLERIDPNPGTP